MRISDWSSDVCSSDLDAVDDRFGAVAAVLAEGDFPQQEVAELVDAECFHEIERIDDVADRFRHLLAAVEEEAMAEHLFRQRSEERRVGKECVSPCRYGWVE